MIICAWALFMFTSCSMFISTPRVAHIQINGADNHQLDEYIVVLDPEYDENLIDIQITDRYAINLDFQWLFNAAIGDETTSTDGPSELDWSATPWMVCTYKF